MRFAVEFAVGFDVGFAVGVAVVFVPGVLPDLSSMWILPALALRPSARHPAALVLSSCCSAASGLPTAPIATDVLHSFSALVEFLEYLDTRGVRTVTLWFDGALQLYSDSFTCPWFVPALLDWAKRT